jgi:hypothetical protein
MTSNRSGGAIRSRTRSSRTSSDTATSRVVRVARKRSIPAKSAARRGEK